MPMGLTNAPATFQRAMNDLFAPYLGQFVVVFLDNILVFSENEESHVQHLRIVLDLLKKHNYYVKLNKCELC